MQEEIWKDIYFEENGVIYDYRGLYQVSDLGNIKSLGNGDNHNARERIMKKTKTKKGYLKVGLWKNRKQKWFLVHRLVAYMFIENDDPEYKTDVNHINEFEKDNNCTNNLEWCTKEYNNNHGTRNERAGKSRNKKVIGYSLTSTKVIVLQSISQANKFGFNSHVICDCCKGKYCRCHEYKGFKWYYFDNIQRKN